MFYNDDQYYTETAAYEFTMSEIELIEKATASLYEMCLEVVDYVIKNQLWDEFLIPREYSGWITDSWKNRQPSFYGRFDLGYRDGQIKMLEFNADTPTLLLESSAIQWFWLQDYNPELDQYNGIHDALVKLIAACKDRIKGSKMYFSANFNHEDFMTVKYMQDVAAQAGLETEYIDIEDIATDSQGRFTGKNGELIENIFKIYPYEWMFEEPFGKYLVQNARHCHWFEPPWKAILSNKMMLKYIYLLFPDSHYLLPAFAIKKGVEHVFPKSYALKPIFSREGDNISLVVDGTNIESKDGIYGKEGYICQDYFELPEFDGMHPIIGSWIIGDKPAGMGIRESRGRITNVTSHFCSHYIKE